MASNPSGSDGSDGSYRIEQILPGTGSAPRPAGSRHGPAPLATTICVTAPIFHLVLWHVAFLGLDWRSRAWPQLVVIGTFGALSTVAAAVGGVVAVRGTSQKVRSIGLGTALGALVALVSMLLLGIALLAWTILAFPVQG